MSTFSPARVRALRERAHLSREQLGSKTGRTGSTIHKIETGAIRPSLGTLAAMAAALNCGVGAFFDEPDPDLAAFADDPSPSDLGPEIDAWVRSTKANMPPMSDHAARTISAIMFPASTAQLRRRAAS